MSCYVVSVSHKNLLLIEENPALLANRDSQQVEINKIFLSLKKKKNSCQEIKGI